jgi:hypothetical protein|tara:strand:- start:2363 stop:2611 length:249 start_codon:yes stop_codon:yes gene_type:complete
MPQPMSAIEPQKWNSVVHPHFAVSHWFGKQFQLFFNSLYHLSTSPLAASVQPLSVLRWIGAVVGEGASEPVLLMVRLVVPCN